MSLRKGHGAGAGSPRVEVLPPDEQPHVAAQADPLRTDRDAAGRVTTTAAAQALARLPRRSKNLPRKLALDPRFERHNPRRLEWRQRRMGELAAAHGGVSHGVGAIVNAAAWLYAGGEMAAEMAAETGDPELFKLAASLTGTARQHELAAWELAAREGEARGSRGEDDITRLDREVRGK